LIFVQGGDFLRKIATRKYRFRYTSEGPEFVRAMSERLPHTLVGAVVVAEGRIELPTLGL
jgi:hypothetical protein